MNVKNSPHLSYDLTAHRPRHQTVMWVGHIRGQYSLYPRHVRSSMLPKKRLSTHTMHFKWHHRNLSKNDHESLETSHKWRHAWSFFGFLIPKMPKIPKFLPGNPDGTWSFQLFLPGPRRFLLGPCPRGPHPGDGVAAHPEIWHDGAN